MNLSMDEKIGQRFIFGVNDNNIECIITLIKKCYIGGVVLYKKNYNSYQELLDVVNRLKDANKDNKIPLLIAIDQEGGRVNRMPLEIHNFKNIYDMSKFSDKLVIDNARITGKMLYNIGINMNLAPVMDIYNNSKSKVLDKRCFYGDMDNVSKLGINYMKELKNNGIIPVIKHFPGHGGTKIDSHLLVPYIFNYKEVLDKHIIPFKNAINNGSEVIMMGHLIIRKLTGGLPASIASDFINKYLRQELKYEGVIITDEINMLKKNIFYRGIYLKKALGSLNDILLIKIKNVAEGLKTINKYKEILLNDKNISRELDNSVKRIVDLKKRYNLSDKQECNKISIKEINDEIDKINETLLKEENKI